MVFWKRLCYDARSEKHFKKTVLISGVINYYTEFKILFVLISAIFKIRDSMAIQFCKNLEETCENVSSIIVLLFQVRWLNPTDQLQYPEALATGTVHFVAPDVSRLVDINAWGDFLGLCDQKSSYKHVPDFGWLRSYDRLKHRIEGNDYWQ